jgi:hypothetical protein
VANLYPAILGLYDKMILFRPYFKGVACTWVAGSTASLTGSTWDIRGVYTGIVTHQIMTFKPNFFAPNTNRYTLDFILSDYYYVNEPGPPLATLPIDAALIFKPGTIDLYLSLDSLNFPDWYYLDLPPSPAVWQALPW